VELQEKLSAPNTKAGRLQRSCLELIKEHRQDGAIPTSIRFLFYELEGRGIIPKTYPGKRQPGQDVSEAMTHLREAGLVDWDEIVDETRSLHNWAYASTVYEHVENRLDGARIDLWEGDPPPLILCESRSLAGVLRNIAGTYLAPIAATNGQTGGFLHTDVGPLVERAHRDDVLVVRVLYLGDLDLSGGHIEENTRRVLEDYAELDWQRIAITEEQVRERSLTKVEKKDNRYRPARTYPAVETEALKQTEIQRIHREALDGLAPISLEEAGEIEEEQRVLVREALMPLGEGSENGHKSPIPEFAIDAVAEEVEHAIRGRAYGLQGVDYSTREAVRRELRHQVARRLLRED
jgi:hypothetical protein